VRLDAESRMRDGERVMRILVAFKVTPDYEALRDADWVAGPGDGVETRYVRRILNCFDESALELALGLRDGPAPRRVEEPVDAEAGVSLGALTIGGRDTEPHLTTLIALGYERAARIDPSAALDFSPPATAALIAGYVRQVGGGDLVLLGCRSGPGDAGVVPFLVAAELGWPCLTQVTAIECYDDDRLRVTCAAEDGALALTLRPPCVLAVGNATVSHLSVPTLSQRLAQRGRRPDVLTPADVGVDVGVAAGDATTELVGLERVAHTRPGTVVEGSTPREKAAALYASYPHGW